MIFQKLRNKLKHRQKHQKINFKWIKMKVINLVQVNLGLEQLKSRQSLIIRD